jgi:hypothetical protein
MVRLSAPATWCFSTKLAGSRSSLQMAWALGQSGESSRSMRGLIHECCKRSNGGSDEDFLMRARVQSFGLARLWPALENLSGRKPRGLGGVYGERALSVGLVTAADALLVRLKTAVCTFCPYVCLRSQLGRCQFAPFA